VPAAITGAAAFVNGALGAVRAAKVFLDGDGRPDFDFLEELWIKEKG